MADLVHECLVIVVTIIFPRGVDVDEALLNMPARYRRVRIGARVRIIENHVSARRRGLNELQSADGRPGFKRINSGRPSRRRQTGQVHRDRVARFNVKMARRCTEITPEPVGQIFGDLVIGIDRLRARCRPGVGVVGSARIGVIIAAVERLADRTHNKRASSDRGRCHGVEDRKVGVSPECQTSLGRILAAGPKEGSRRRNILETAPFWPLSWKLVLKLDDPKSGH